MDFLKKLKLCAVAMIVTGCTMLTYIACTHIIAILSGYPPNAIVPLFVSIVFAIAMITVVCVDSR